MQITLTAKIQILPDEKQSLQLKDLMRSLTGLMYIHQAR